MEILVTIIASVLFAIIAPIVGCLLAGLDRIISARMQGRVGPPLLQPYYDVRKLLSKEKVAVNTVQGAYIVCALIFACLAGGIFYSGGNLLMCIFVITLSSLFLIMAAYSTRSPYSEIGAARETLQVMSYEPMVLLFAVGFYMATCEAYGLESYGSFNIGFATSLAHPVICVIWPIFIGLVYILTIKLRKSPFDISMSHHAHQEIVRGVTTEMSGSTLALVEIMHWCENVLFLGWVGIFFVWSNPVSIVIAVVVALVIYFLEIFIDNNFARVKWQFMFKSAWLIALILGGINIAVLAFI
jgi:ech hydrogenase subunit B